MIQIIAFLLILAVLLDLSLGVAYVISRARTAASGAPPLFSPRWSLLDVWIGAHALVGGLIPVGIFAVILIMLVYGNQDFTNLKGDPLILLLAIGMAGQTVLMIGIPALFITQKYRVSLPQIGFGWPPNRGYIVTGIKYGLLLFAVVLILQLIVTQLLQLIAGPVTAKEVNDLTSKMTAERMLKENRTVPMFITMLIIAGILAPFAEEMFFRGFLYNASKRRLGVIGGAVFSGVVFAAVHFGPLAVLLIVPMGIALALAYEKTQSLWVPIAMHATNNFIAVTVTFLMPNL